MILVAFVKPMLGPGLPQSLPKLLFMMLLGVAPEGCFSLGDSLFICFHFLAEERVTSA